MRQCDSTCDNLENREYLQVIENPKTYARVPLAHLSQFHGSAREVLYTIVNSRKTVTWLVRGAVPSLARGVHIIVSVLLSSLPATQGGAGSMDSVCRGIVSSSEELSGGPWNLLECQRLRPWVTI